ncbi:MAG: hypothetical protein CMA64_00230 [Euryarchaeota archaeon]|jgi:hypothetical protein|nr:hypothetical protein [Euryarchaeota archaeon]
MNSIFQPVKHKIQAKELKDAATEAVFGLQLSKDKAIRFILRNVKGSNVKQARKALEFACTSYKMEEPDYNF